tara:strand:- start:15890 stop:16897 length:1008 start_codon:yes stop_codon:yes gene_type:complete
MKKILYYVSDHGLGHLTRSIAIMREFKDEAEFVIRNSNTYFIEESLPNVKIIPGKTDQGTLSQNNGISIDWEKSKIAIDDWYNEFDSTLTKEQELISKINPDLIITDVSPLPLPISKKLSIPSIVISNFTWMDIFSNIPRFQNNFLSELYQNASMCIQLPLSTPMDTFKNKQKIGLVSKKPTVSRDFVRRTIGVEKSKFLILVNLPSNFTVNIPSEPNIQIVSTGAKVNSVNSIVIKPWVEGQNLIASSDLVISKCGYGMISECLTNGVPIKFLMDNKHPEQKAMNDELESLGINSSINDWSSNEVSLNLDVSELPTIAHDNSKAKELILEFLRN